MTTDPNAPPSDTTHLDTTDPDVPPPDLDTTEALAGPAMPQEVRERLRALRAAQVMPLRDRAAVRVLGVLDVAHDEAPTAVHTTGPLAGRPRGLAAIIPTDTPVEQVIESAAEQEWQGPERRARVRIDGRARLEGDWLVTPTTRVLHHAPLTATECAELVTHEGVERDDAPEPLTLTCGRTAWAVARPNRIERAAMPRCEQCCTTLGYPAGYGSPQRDDTCTPVLLTRLDRLARA